MTGCAMCEPAPHRNCEVYTQIHVEDPKTGSGSVIDVCMEHYEVVQNAVQ